MSALQTRRMLVIGMCSAPFAARAQGAFVPQAGSDFQILERPQPVESGDKIEILEFFQYSCPHCYAYTPALGAWRKHLAADVLYRRVPLAFDPSVHLHIQLYYTLEALNRVDDMHDKVFTAYHVQHRQLTDSNEIADFMAANGIDRSQWLAAFNSFGVATKSLQSAKIAGAYEITGTPTMACDGKYLTSPSMMHVDSSVDRARAAEAARVRSTMVLDYLIERSRRERGRAPRK